MAGDGSPAIDFNSFSKRYDQDPELQALVQDFNKNELVLKTNTEPSENIPSEEKESKISDIAKKAVRKSR